MTKKNNLWQISKIIRSKLRSCKMRFRGLRPSLGLKSQRLSLIIKMSKSRRRWTTKKDWTTTIKTRNIRRGRIISQESKYFENIEKKFWKSQKKKLRLIRTKPTKKSSASLKTQAMRRKKNCACCAPRSSTMTTDTIKTGWRSITGS